MTSATTTGYGPRHRGLMFDGEESKYELWEIKFLGYMRLRKLSDMIDPRSDDARGELTAADEANNADAFAELIVQMPGRQPRFLVCLQFFLRFLLHFTLYLRNPVDATLASLSNFRYSRWPPPNSRTIQLNIMLLLYYIIM